MTRSNDVVRVYLVDDQQLVRAGLRMVLDAQPDITVVGEADGGREAVHALAVTAADVVLMDVRMPGMDGIEATRQLLAQGRSSRPTASPLRVIVLTTFDLDTSAYQALAAGASGFLLKNSPPETLVDAVRTVHRGDAVIAPSTTRRLIRHLLPAPAHPRRVEQRRLVDTLTAREREVLALVARGMSNAEISRELFVSPTTVKTHVANLLGKLGVRDRAQAIVVAYESGLVDPAG